MSIARHCLQRPETKPCLASASHLLRVLASAEVGTVCCASTPQNRPRPFLLLTSRLTSMSPSSRCDEWQLSWVNCRPARPRRCWNIVLRRVCCLRLQLRFQPAPKPGRHDGNGKTGSARRDNRQSVSAVRHHQGGRGRSDCAHVRRPKAYTPARTRIETKQSGQIEKKWPAKKRSRHFSQRNTRQARALLSRRGPTAGSVRSNGVFQWRRRRAGARGTEVDAAQGDTARRRPVAV